MERGDQEVAGPADAVAGEDAAGPVRAVRARRETDEQQACPRIAEAGNRPRPVCIRGEGTALLATDALAILAQTRTAVASDDRVANRNQSHHTGMPLGSRYELLSVSPRAIVTAIFPSCASRGYN